jgi:hypothetical protein
MVVINTIHLWLLLTLYYIIMPIILPTMLVIAGYLTWLLLTLLLLIIGLLYMVGYYSNNG